MLAMAGFFLWAQYAGKGSAATMHASYRHPNTMSDHFRQSARHGLYLAICAGLMACSNFDGASNRLASLVTPYQIDVVQGNFVSSEQVALLKTGMGRQAVRDLLGTPLLQSLFHADRWDYVFTFKRKGAEPQLRKVTVYFKNDELDHFDADALPTEADFVASLDSGRKTVKVPLLDASEESLKRFPSVDKTPEIPTVLPPLPASYPPLEPASP
jgi:outer membrane protein assembly factor BamE